jgi:hypothetical protein
MGRSGAAPVQHRDKKETVSGEASSGANKGQKVKTPARSRRFSNGLRHESKNSSPPVECLCD